MPASPAYYPVIILSDLHLGIRNNAAGMLAEFLNNTRCDTLILNGDVIDGTRRGNRHVGKFPEEQKQILDILNRKIAEGTKIYYLPGNHDASLRNGGILGKNIFGIEFARSLDFTDPKQRRFLIAHGDNFSGDVVPPEPKRTRKTVFRDYFYTIATGASARMDGISSRLFQHHIGLASKVRTAIETRSGLKERYVQTGLKHAHKHSYDGVIYGHFHMPEIATDKAGKTYMNSGDWMENFSALTLDAKGSWSVVKWPELRRKMKLSGTFNAVSADAGTRKFRPQTEKMVAAIEKVWPSPKRSFRPR